MKLEDIALMLLVLTIAFNLATSTGNINIMGVTSAGPTVYPTNIPTSTKTPVPTGPTSTTAPGAPSPTQVLAMSPTSGVLISPTTKPSNTPPPPSPTTYSITCPSTSSNNINYYKLLDEKKSLYKTADPSADQHPDLNLSKRGFEPTNESTSLQTYTANPSKKPPQLKTLFNPSRNANFAKTYRVYDWDWTNNRKGSLATNYPVTVAGLAATPRENLYPPFSDYDIGDNIPEGTPIPYPYQVYVMYADQNQITLKYDRRDTAALGFMVHLYGICTDTNLLKVYDDANLNNPSNRDTADSKLIAVHQDTPIGVAKSNEVIVAVRSDGTFMDPRSTNDWWK